MARRTVAAALAALAGAAAAAPGGKDVTAVMFEWNFASVAKACTDELGPAGYGRREHRYSRWR
ncbi:hypothetical protein ACFPC0_24820 [Streptomyces andamanensis]|uniref:Uncharacterized protein n=1 Tax=Streptomyces andamanensis TaxID=1565035 RepID=A0ABV8TK47_9ACTN